MLLFSLYLLSFIQTFYHTSANSTLRQIHLFFRHGDRTPTETYKNDPYINYPWEDGWGQLTKLGKHQLYQLGQTFATVYEEFLPRAFLTSDNVKVYSSYSERCHLSAQVLLAGMFPPSKDLVWNDNLLWQPIPITSIPRNKDTIIVMKAPCLKYSQEFKNVFQTDAMKEIDKENTNLYKNLTEYTGEEINGIERIEQIYNTLEIEQTHNLTLPEWTKSVFPEKMWFAASKTLAIYTDNQYMKKMTGGFFVKFVLSKMKNIINNKKEATVYLYSGHDISLTNILRSLGVKDIFKPGFAASFVLELHEEKGVYFIKLFYRDDFAKIPEKLELEGCSAFCSFEEFKNKIAPVIPSDFNKECENKEKVDVFFT